jgi:D-inositol-3-phosphate glycosyltransferase
MKKIAMISDHASPLALLGGVDSGGQNVYVAQVARHLAQKGFRVDIFTRRESALQEEIYDYDTNIRVIHVPAGPAQYVPKENIFPYMRDFARYMARFFLREGAYDVMHANFWMSGMVASDLKKIFGIPYVVTFHALGHVRRLHQGENDGFPDCRMACEEQVAMDADRVIAECPQDKTDLIEFYHTDPEKIEVIPCGFDSEEFWPVHKKYARSLLGFDPEEKIILQLGRMVPRKGIDTVISAFAIMSRAQGLDAKLVIVGGDPEDPFGSSEMIRLQNLAKAEGMEKNVIFKGPVQRSQLKHYYSAADMFVTTPWYEPFGITPLEAMACGTSVIGSRVGGIKYTVVDEETGFLVSPKDTAELAGKMALLYRHPLLRISFESNAVQRVQSMFKWETIVDSLAGTYEDVRVHSSPCLGYAKNVMNFVRSGGTRKENSDGTAGLAWRTRGN